MNSRRAFTVWGIAVLAYVASVTQRSSLGVAGVEAAERFHITAATLSTLAVVQLAVYAALQVPVGVILDRRGPRFMIVTGSLLMAVGQVAVAVAPTVSVAIAGRILVGAGDACLFISVIRLLSAWFSGRLLPQVSQWTGNLGALGQVISALPLSFVLERAGWSPAFLAAASFSVLALVLAVLLVRDGPMGTGPVILPSTWSESLGHLRQSLRRPGTQLGFWSHFVTQSSGTVFSLLWGFPLLTEGLGYSREVASVLLTAIVATGFVAGPAIGILSARFPMRRSNLVLGIVAALGIVWAVVLVWPGLPPFWLVVVLVIALGAGGPGSLVGFDFARSFNPARALGSANGIVNVGGFLASFLMMFLIGVVLDAENRARMAVGLPSDVFAWDSFRVALLVQYVVVGVGVVLLVRARRRTRRHLHESEGIEVAPIWVAIGRAWRRRSG
jgi:sugar phosphate permease